jgi:hypothetical protein
MRFVALLFAATLTAAPALAQDRPASAGSAAGSAAASTAEDSANRAPLDLPVSLDRIKTALAKPPANQLRGLNEQPQFRVEVQERSKLEDLVASLNFKTGPVPAGGLYAAEQQRVLFPSVDNPLRQPYAAFNQGELLTILIENLVGHYFAGRALDSVTASERAHAEAAARAEVQQAVRNYCLQQPNHGATITICTNPLP